MSDDDKKNGNAKVARLLDRAKNRFKDEGANEPEVVDESLELDIDDPTREQETPPTLTPESDLELDLEDGDDNRGGKRPGFLARMTMLQRVMLVGVVGVAFIGFKNLGGNGDLAYLDEPQSPSDVVRSPQDQPQAPSDQAVNEPSEPSLAIAGDGFEAISQGVVTPDSNTIDLTPGASQLPDDNAFSDDSLSPNLGGSIPDQQSRSELSNPAIAQSGIADQRSNAPTGSPDLGPDEGIDFGSNDDASDVAPEDVVMTNRPVGTKTLDGEFVPPPASRGDSSFRDSSLGPQNVAKEVDSIKSTIESLSSDLSSLSQSVASMKGEISGSARTNQELRQDVRKLMAELKVRDASAQGLESRPDISDLVIFRPAANCSDCIPHALFAWQGKDVEVGDGLRWQGFDVAIRGDRLSLIDGENVHHYWYR